MFTFDKFVFVPAERQVAIYSMEGHKDGHKPLVTFYQAQVTNPTYKIMVGETQLNFEAEFRLAEPTPDVMVIMMNGIKENIAPYLNKGVIGSDKTQGDITFRNEKGIWFMTRGMESITISNKHHVPDDDCDYWIAFTHGCTHCDSAPNFEFMGVESSVLIIPEGVTLTEHLRPFVQTICDEIRRVRIESHPLRGLLDVLPFSRGLQGKVDSHVNEVIKIAAGVPEIYVGTLKDEIGGIKIDDVEVLALYHRHSLVFGEQIDVTDDEDVDNPVDVDSDLLGSVASMVAKRARIPLTDIDVKNFHFEVMAKVTMNALENDYNAIDSNSLIQRQLFRIIQSAAIPGPTNWWLRVVANVWLMHSGYPQHQVQDQAVRQLEEMAGHLKVDGVEAVEIRFRLRDVIKNWYE